MSDGIELLVVWKHPQTRLRFHIGRLRRDSAGYHFRLETECNRSFLHAKQSGFRLLPFHEPNQTYENDELFPVFASRLPRPEAFEALGLHPSQDMEYFVETGGRLATDTLEFLEPVALAPPDMTSINFPIAGWRHYEGKNVANRLTPGRALQLSLQADNEFDPCAIQVLFEDCLLGYVPLVYAYYIDRAVQAKRYKAEVISIGGSEDSQLRIRVNFCAPIEALEGVSFMPKELTRRSLATV